MKLLYIMDPQCGWCYGNSAQISTLKKALDTKIEFELVPGGMWLGEQAPQGGRALHDFMLQNGPRLEQVTGVKLSSKFYELANNPDYTFGSLEPSATIKWVKDQFPSQAFDFASEVQKLLFTKGLRLDRLDNYKNLVQGMNLDWSRFKSECLSDSNLEKTTQEFQIAQSLAQGFPSLILVDGGQNHLIRSGYFEAKDLIAAFDNL